jgi:arylsulfatase A-like enzyme
LAADRAIGKLLAYINKGSGLQNALVILTSDHGVAPSPEILASQKMPGGRIKGRFFDPIQTALTAKFGAGLWLLSTAGSSPYFNYELIREKKLDPFEVQKVAASAIEQEPHVARVYTRQQLLMRAAGADAFDNRVMRSFHSRRSGDLEILLDSYWIRGSTNATHGTPYNYDTHIPLIFMGTGVKPGRYYQSASMNDIAPTVAAMLDIEIPSGSVGRILGEMFVSP